MQKDNLNIKKGEVFAFKTDTVWGFGCLPDDDLAINKIYEIKKRDSKKPLILMSNNFEYLKKYIKNVPDYAHKLIEKHLPGGLTLIFEKSEILNPLVCANSNTVGIRIPNSKDFSSLVDKIEGKVLATTSCNVSDEAPVMNYKEAMEKFSSCATIVKPIVDSENENVPSTVILCKENDYVILRQGVVKL